MNGKYQGFRVWWLVAAVLGGSLLGVGACQWGNGQSPPEPPDQETNVAAPAAPTGPPVYQDVTAQCGIEFTYHNGQEAGHMAILESLGGGVALIDYDGDGLLDIFVTGGGYYDGPDKQVIKGHPCKLYKNLGNWKFKDVTKEVGLADLGGQPWFYTHGAAVADYDRDGFPDLLVTGYGRVALFHNVPDPKAPGGRRFVEVTRQAGLLQGGHIWATSAAWADFDGDGFPDLYVCQYVNWSFDPKLGINPKCPGYYPGIPRDVCAPKVFESRAHRLYKNNGNGTFTDVSDEAGIRMHREKKKTVEDRRSRRLIEERDDREYGKGLGVVVVDVNGDGKPDIAVANDTTNKFLYMNRSTGPGNFRFEELGMECCVALDDHASANGSMGTDAGDYNGTGRPSLWLTNYENENHGLYRNEPPRTPGGREDRVFFQFATQEAGIAAGGQPHVGFGTGFLDIENRGELDLAIINGHVIRFPKGVGIRQPAFLLQNNGGKFRDISSQGGSYFQAKHPGRGLAIGDLNNDGLPDLVVSHVNDPVVVLRNISPAGNHWLGIELQGKDRRDVVGAKLTLEVAGRTLTRFAKGGGSYLSSSDRRLVFGLAKETKSGKLKVEWPSGEPRKQQWDNLPIDRYWRLVQGKDQPQTPPGAKAEAPPRK